MNAVTPASAGALAGLQSLRAGLTGVRATIAQTSSDPYLRLLRHGVWVYGQEDTEVQPGSLWAINPLSICHGFVCWSRYPVEQKRKDEKLGEVMVSLQRPLPDIDALPQHEFPWKQQLSVQTRCLTGEDAGLQTRYVASSVGGLNAVSKLIEAILTQLDAGTDKVVPVVEWLVDSYKHKQYGQTFTPIIAIKRWVALTDAPMDSDIAPEPEPAPVAAPVAQPQRRAPVAEAAPAAPAARARRSPLASPQPAQETVGTGFAAEVAAAVEPTPTLHQPAPEPVAAVRTRRRPAA